MRIYPRENEKVNALLYRTRILATRHVPSAHLGCVGALHHVTARENAHEDIFRDNRDRATLLDLLGRETTQQRCNRSHREGSAPLAWRARKY